MPTDAEKCVVLVKALRKIAVLTNHDPGCPCSACVAYSVLAWYDDTMSKAEYFEACALWAKEHLSLDDILAADDPYDLFEVMASAWAANQTPEDFMAETFEEDLARQQYDNEQVSEALEEEPE